MLWVKDLFALRIELYWIFQLQTLNHQRFLATINTHWHQRSLHFMRSQLLPLTPLMPLRGGSVRWGYIKGWDGCGEWGRGGVWLVAWWSWWIIIRWMFWVGNGIWVDWLIRSVRVGVIRVLVDVTKIIELIENEQIDFIQQEAPIVLLM